MLGRRVLYRCTHVAICTFTTRIKTEYNWKAAVRSVFLRGFGFHVTASSAKIDSLKNIYGTRVISKRPLTIYENIDLENKGLFR